MLRAEQLPKGLRAEGLGIAAGQHVLGTVPLWAIHRLSILEMLRWEIFQAHYSRKPSSWSSDPSDPEVWSPASYSARYSALGVSPAGKDKVTSPGMSLAERARTIQVIFPSLPLIISKSFARSLLA